MSFDNVAGLYDFINSNNYSDFYPLSIESLETCNISVIDINPLYSGYHFICKECKEIPKIFCFKKDTIKLNCSCKISPKEISIKNIFDHLIDSGDDNNMPENFLCKVHKNEKNIFYCKKCELNCCNKCINDCVEDKHEIIVLKFNIKTIHSINYIFQKIKEKKLNYFGGSKSTSLFLENDQSNSQINQNNPNDKNNIKKININENNNDNFNKNDIKNKTDNNFKKNTDNEIISFEIKNDDSIDEDYYFDLFSIIINDFNNYPNSNNIKNISSIENYIKYYYDKFKEIKLNYQIEKNNIKDNAVELFGQVFVNNNKDNFFLVINENLFDLNRFINLKEIFEDKNLEYKYPIVLEAKLIEKYNRKATDLSLMFFDINILHYSSDFSNYDISCKGICYLKGRTRGCKLCCALEYNHSGNHNCGEIHFCIENCYLKDLAKNCGGICALEYPHEGKEHNCLEKHYCKQKCHLINKAISCNQECSLQYGHKLDCICSLVNHICNGKCEINNNCHNHCTLLACHQGKCLCGKCSCPEICMYFPFSRNCKKKCQFIGGHEGNHKCAINNHLCKELCIFKDKSINCNSFCHYIIEFYSNHNEHICEFRKENHGCPGTCHLFSITKKNICKKKCIFEIGHKGEHLCEAQRHECDKICQFKSNSRNCYGCCKEYLDNIDTSQEHNCTEKCFSFKNHQHLCALQKEDHKCNKKCSLNKEIGMICQGICSLNIYHEGYCICDRGKGAHICNQVCSFNQYDGCGGLCSLPLGHNNNHNCGEIHRCREICYLHGISIGCKMRCCLVYPHEGNHQCGSEHICAEKCFLYGISIGCNFNCMKMYGHSGNHQCNATNHICNKNCYYYTIGFRDSQKCHINCCLSFGHKGICICKTPHEHLCNKNCSLYGKSGGCNQKCKLEYGHNNECLCYLNNEANTHICLKKCILCDKNCGHVYNHNNQTLLCLKCGGNCKLSKKDHLCGDKHYCTYDCEENGYCDIKIIVKEENYITNNSRINYAPIQIQRIIRKKCCIIIPSNEFSHSGKHKCFMEIHRCGYKCAQCNYYCDLIYGHQDLHNGYHGKMKNLSSNFVMENNNFYKLKEDDIKELTCDKYCLEQGQGHTHFIKKSAIPIQNENFGLFNSNVRPYNNEYYECKCCYFWEYILKFKPNFLNKEKFKFNQCNCICQNISHKDDKDKNYCQLELWHKNIQTVPKGMIGWVSLQGHLFTCKHPKPAYTIFLVAQSGSMEDKSIMPNRIDIKNNMNCKLGAIIELILEFCKQRFLINQKEMCALIGYNDNASLIFDGYSVGEEEKIKTKCLTELKPKGCAFLIHAFIEAKYILEKINREEYIPVIILLTDGLDFKPNEALDYIENDVSSIYSYLFGFFKYFNIVNEK